LLCVEIKQGLEFPSVEYITKRIVNEIDYRNNNGNLITNVFSLKHFNDIHDVYLPGMVVKVVVLECSKLTDMDYTVALVRIDNDIIHHDNF